MHESTRFADSSMLGVSSFSLRAQEKDFATWANVGFEYKLKPAFTVSGGLEWRTKDDLGKTDRWGLKVGGSYKLLPFLKLGAGYETHYRNRGADGWKFRHRYRLEGTLSARVQRVKLSLRERFQYTFDGHRDEFRLRSRAKFAYDIPKCKLEPYASAEMYNGLNRTEHFGVKADALSRGNHVASCPGAGRRTSSIAGNGRRISGRI